MKAAKIPASLTPKSGDDPAPASNVQVPGPQAPTSDKSARLLTVVAAWGAAIITVVGSALVGAHVGANAVAPPAVPIHLGSVDGLRIGSQGTITRNDFCETFVGTADPSTNWTLWSAARTASGGTYTVVAVPSPREGTWSEAINVGLPEVGADELISVEFFYLPPATGVLLGSVAAPDHSISMSTLPLDAAGKEGVTIRRTSGGPSKSCN